jgi:hypothetical protein
MYDPDVSAEERLLFHYVDSNHGRPEHPQSNLFCNINCKARVYYGGPSVSSPIIRSTLLALVAYGATELTRNNEALRRYWCKAPRLFLDSVRNLNYVTPRDSVVAGIFIGTDRLAFRNFNVFLMRYVSAHPSSVTLSVYVTLLSLHLVLYAERFPVVEYQQLSKVLPLGAILDCILSFDAELENLERLEKCFGQLKDKDVLDTWPSSKAVMSLTQQDIIQMMTLAKEKFSDIAKTLQKSSGFRERLTQDSSVITNIVDRIQLDIQEKSPGVILLFWYLSRVSLC